MIVFENTEVRQNILELSFYSFLEQYFYNTNNLKIAESTCPHSFYKDCRLYFNIDIIRIEVSYHPVDIYEVDLVCFKDIQGNVSKDQMQESFNLERNKLLD